MVRKERLELSRVAPQDPKSSASTNSATFASFQPTAPAHLVQRGIIADWSRFVGIKICEIAEPSNVHSVGRHLSILSNVNDAVLK